MGAVSGIILGLSYGVYKFKSRVCAIILLLSSAIIFLEILLSSRMISIFLLLCGISVEIYFNGVRSVFYLQSNKSAND